MGKNQKTKPTTKKVVEEVREEIVKEAVDILEEETNPELIEESVEEVSEKVEEKSSEESFVLITVNVPKLNVRVSPSKKSTIINVVEQGTSLKAKPFSENVEWIALLEGGFVMAEYVIY